LNSFYNDVDDMVLTVVTPTYAPSTSPSTHPSSSPTGVCANPIRADCPASVCDGCAICGEVFGEQFVHGVDLFNYRIKVCDGQSTCQDCDCGVYQQDRNTNDIYFLGSFIRFENVIGKEKTIKAIFEGGESNGCPDNESRSSIVTFDKECCEVCDEYVVRVSEEVPCVYQITLIFFDDGTCVLVLSVQIVLLLSTMVVLSAEKFLAKNLSFLLVRPIIISKCVMDKAHAKTVSVEPFIKVGCLTTSPSLVHLSGLRT